VAVVQFINGLFGADHPLDSKVEYSNTETVSRKLRRLLSDILVIVNGVHVYHVEAEIGHDENIVIRVFEYGFAEGLRTKTVLDGGKRITLKLPEARIIYWETTKHTPDEVVLVLEFPDGGSYEYKVKALKFLSHEIHELEEKKLAILLPFYVLKLRRQVASAKKPETRVKLAKEMSVLLDDLVAAVERAAYARLMTETDKRSVLEYLERLYRELYKGYKELREADVMLQDTILTYSEEAELRGLRKGRREGIAKGIKRGIERGLEKGIAKGIEKGKEETAKKLLARGDYSLEAISDIVGLPLERVKALVN
jgi:hypothetical protein